MNGDADYPFLYYIAVIITLGFLFMLIGGAFHLWAMQ